MVLHQKPKSTPFSYILIRLLFKFVLKVFYGTIVIENEEYLPKKGESCILCANHTNSLTDALLLMTSSKSFLRMTAKSTQFGKKTFSSWLIESSGALPIKRRMDHVDATEADNTEVMKELYEALGDGDAVCLFPEGMSRYRPALSPLKTGVARIISQVLSMNRHNPTFSITLLTCSVTYMHRQHFRSDVLVTFNPPIKLSPKDHPSLLAPVDFRIIKSLTGFMAKQISAGTLDAPSWDVIRTAKVASKMYAPLGTQMTLGDHVRVTRTFVEGFKKTGEGWTQVRERSNSWEETDTSISGDDVSGDHRTRTEQQARRGEARKQDEVVDLLAQDLKEYHSRLLQMGLKDDRIRVGPLPRRVILGRIAARTLWLAVLSFIALPGLLLWTPVFAATTYTARRFSQSGPPEDVWDEIAQNKLLVGLFSGVCVWSACVFFTLPMAPFTFFFVPLLMWMSLRFLEDSISAFRALTALTSLLWIGRPTLYEMSARRRQLYRRVMDLAVGSLGLPEDPEKHFRERGGREKGRARGNWESSTGYFSIRRRRKKEWNEILRIWPQEE